MSLAERHVSINHSLTNQRFYELGLAEIINGSIHSVPNSDYMMILEGTDSSFTGADPDNPFRSREGAFLIIRQAAISNFQDIGNAYNECEKIADEIIRRMYLDSELALNLDPSVIPEAQSIRGFQANSVHAQITIGMLSGAFYGVRYQYNILHEFSLTQIDDTKWQ